MTGALRILPMQPGQLDTFIRVPAMLYGGDPHWVTPLMMERRGALKPGGTPFLRRAQTAQWIAWRDERPVGRISAQIDPLALERHPGTGHFGLLAAEDDPEVFAALLNTAENWLRGHGMQRVLGPLDLSINEESGLLVDGFSTPPMLMMGHDPPYAGRRLEQAGYGKAKDLLAYLLDCADDFPAPLRKLMERPPPAGLTIRPMIWRDYKAEVHRLVDIFNDAWSGNWGFVAITEDEVELMAVQMRPLIDERLVWFAELNGEAVAFLVCLPNINEAITDLNGRLFPFGWAKLLWRLKVRGLKSARVPLMGVRRRLAGKLVGGMLPFLLIAALRGEVIPRGIRKVELSWVLEDNGPMRAVAEALCGAPYKTYRLYERPLA